MLLRKVIMGGVHYYYVGVYTIEYRGNTSPWQHVTMTTHHHDNTSPWQHITMTTRHHDNTSPWQHVTMTTRHHDNTSPWQHITMTLPGIGRDTGGTGIPAGIWRFCPGTGTGRDNHFSRYFSRYFLSKNWEFSLIFLLIFWPIFSLYSIKPLNYLDFGIKIFPPTW